MSIITKIVASKDLGGKIAQVGIGVVIGALAVIMFQCKGQTTLSTPTPIKATAKVEAPVTLPRTSAGKPLTVIQHDTLWLDRIADGVDSAKADSLRTDTSSFAINDSTEWKVNDTLTIQKRKYAFVDSGYYYLSGIVDVPFKKFRHWKIDGSPYHVPVIELEKDEMFKYEISASLATSFLFNSYTKISMDASIFYKQYGVFVEPEIITDAKAFRFYGGVKIILFK